METLPPFKYHPDPVATGSVAPSQGKKCRRCKRDRGYLYVGPVYAEEELDGALCPFCIADGSAAEKFDATFTDIEGLEDGMPDAAIDEITERTPGFASWQESRWLACCDDGMAFVGPMGLKEIRANYYELEGEAVTYVVQQMGISGRAAINLVEALDKDKGPTMYLFKCLRCERLRFYIDRP